jgi:glycosyltransferase involved in cell wall biosynthesis
MSQQKSPTICLNMIVKNESQIIRRCLDSVYKHIDTWCIVDTGSTDGTQDIIKDFLKDKPGVLHERPWINFGHNRNEGLQLAREWGDWILLTDADMVLIDTGFNKNVLDYSADVYDLMQDNNGTCYNNMRLLSTKKAWKCIGVTHEYYDCEGGTQDRRFLDTLYFNDISDGGSKGDKFERDIRLLTQGLIDEPTNVRYMFYLAQSYRDVGDYENAIKWYNNRVKGGGWDEEVWFAQYMIGWCMNARGDSYEAVWDTMMIAWRMRPWRVEPLWLLATEARKKNLWQHAYQISKICATTPWPKNDVLFIAKNAYGVGTLDEFSVAAYWAGYPDEAEHASLKLIAHPNLPSSEVPRIKKNLWFCRKALGRFSEEALENYINEMKTRI